MAAAPDPELLGNEPEAPVQLSLDDEISDDLSFGAWVEALPIRLEEAA
jgi:hypothetical protein